MKIERIENFEDIKVTPPPIETIIEPEILSWPDYISDNPKFIEQVKDRQRLIYILNIITSKIDKPNISIDEAFSDDKLSENEITELYKSLSHLLDDLDYKRALLYIPFEFIPGIKILSNTNLYNSAKKFLDSYMNAWYSMLNIHDVRANFIDGDVLEIEKRTGDLPRVVKVAHLIPKLIEKKMLKIEDVLKLLDETTDQVLQQSIIDTIPVLYDLNLINIEQISTLKSLNPTEIFNEITSYKKNQKQRLNISLESLEEKIQLEFNNIDTKEYHDVTEKRTEWLKEQDKNKIIESLSDQISLDIIENKLEIIDENFSEFKTLTQKVLIEGVRKAIEIKTEDDMVMAKNIYIKYKPILHLLWKKNTYEIRSDLLKLFRRLYWLKIVDPVEISDLDITTPDLSESFSKNIKSIESETEKIKSIINTIKTNQTLSRFVYPVVIIYGSKIKGYGSENSDVDVAIIIKPNTPISKQEEIEKEIETLFENKQIKGVIPEFWLDDMGEYFTIHNFSNHNTIFGEKWWTYVLFGGLWEGDESAILELRNKLLAPYFRETDEIIHGHNARELYLEELERDTLQYRLMHKGYERFYPSFNPIKKLHSHRIDGESAFWDSGYRRMAIKLFASRVFLPKI